MSGQTMPPSRELPLWSLRPDIELVELSDESGRPAFLVHDPVAETFDRVDWPECDLLGALRRPATVPQLKNAFERANPMRPGTGDVADYIVELGKRGWLRDSRFWPAGMPARPGAGGAGWAARLLFLQIPLVRPSHFLHATRWLGALWLNGFTLFLFFLCGLAGAYLTLPRWEEFRRDCLGSDALARLPGFLVALALVKLVHELAHAYEATRRGARVKAMGVAFFFFMPLPFTDVSDAWRLDWPSRLRVAAAGMLAEMCLACASFLLWALSPPGETAMVLARLASVAVVSTILTNINPGPRFDGYFILACVLRVENLRARSTAMLRRTVLRVVFGVDASDPEERVEGWRRAGMAGYGVYSIFYRISLGIGMALLAYYMFPKAIGLWVIALEGWLFFGRPFLRGAAGLWRLRKSMRFTIGSLVALVLLLGAGVWFFGEWPRRLHFPAVTRAASDEAVRSRRAGVLAEVRVRRGDRIEEGQVLAVLESPVDAPLLRGAEWAVREAAIGEEQSWSGAAARRESANRTAERKSREERLSALRQRGELLSVTAPSTGELVHWEDSLVPGVSVGRGRLLGWIVGGAGVRLSCYPDIETAGRLKPGAEVRFFPDSGGGSVPGRVVRVERSRPEILEDTALAGALGAVRREGRYVLGRPYAKVEVVLEWPISRVGQTGVVWAWSKPESLAERTRLWLRGLAVRESGF